MRRRRYEARRQGRAHQRRIARDGSGGGAPLRPRRGARVNRGGFASQRLGGGGGRGREGARVIIGDVLEAEGRAVEADVRARGGEAVFTRLDVTSEADWQRAVDLALKHFGTLNVLINNAGIG